eukprot:gene4087-5835_t
MGCGNSSYFNKTNKDSNTTKINENINYNQTPQSSSSGNNLRAISRKNSGGNGSDETSDLDDSTGESQPENHLASKNKNALNSSFNLNKNRIQYIGVSIGMKLLSLDEFNSKYTGAKMYKWRLSEVVSLVKEDNSQVLIHYIGWSETFDYVVDLKTEWYRLAPLDYLSIIQMETGAFLSESQAEIVQSYFLTGQLIANNNNGSSCNHKFRIGQYVEVQDRFYKRGSKELMYKWRYSQIVDLIGFDKVRIHYVDWEDKYDETIPTPTDRIREVSNSNNSNNNNNSRRESFRESTITENNNNSFHDNNYTVDRVQERLFVERLYEHGLRIIEVEGDGNCLFRAVSHQLYCTEKYHKKLRNLCADHLIEHRKRFESFCPLNFDEYIRLIRECGTWADDIEIRALEEIIDRIICIYSADSIDKNGTYVPFNKNFEEEYLLKDVTPVNLSYHGHSHYNSIYDMQREQLPLEPRTTQILLENRIKLFEMENKNSSTEVTKNTNNKRDTNITSRNNSTTKISSQQSQNNQETFV